MTGDRNSCWRCGRRRPSRGLPADPPDEECGLIYSEQDLWEETGGYLIYTNAACIAGLEAGGRGGAGSGPRGRTLAGELWPPRCAGTVATGSSCRDGCYVGERTRTGGSACGPDYMLDISNLGLAVPVPGGPAGSPRWRDHQRLEAEVDYPVDGVGRYASDLFMGGNPWSSRRDLAGALLRRDGARCRRSTATSTGAQARDAARLHAGAKQPPDRRPSGASPWPGATPG